jgi:Mg-chelatase subunit ChlD
VGIGNLVRSYNPGAEGAEGVERLAAHPLTVILLDVARGYVVRAGVAEHIVHRIGGRDPVGRLPDNHGQFRLVVDHV